MSPSPSRPSAVPPVVSGASELNGLWERPPWPAGGAAASTSTYQTTGPNDLDRHGGGVGLVGRRLGVVVVDGVGEGVVAGEVGRRVVGEGAVGFEGDVVAAGTVGAADRRRAGGEPGGGVSTSVSLARTLPAVARCGPVVVVPTARRVLARAPLAPVNESSPATGGVVDRGDGDVAGDDVAEVVGAGPVVDLEGDGAGPGGRVLAGVGEADVAQGRLVVGDRSWCR